ncbi:hypothetical protein PsorP6_001337 [Peronosclerospora sorghi]|uniref:Uncharacterized protein n=1 Tax=Peronosclerospora sorghi TaxID=230839 RepID=A0ACC0WVA4_9STRA|nr:hypothetical protein PsorP6_001337 [Peronosclerospora sorghi]
MEVGACFDNFAAVKRAAAYHASINGYYFNVDKHDKKRLEGRGSQNAKKWVAQAIHTGMVVNPKTTPKQIQDHMQMKHGTVPSYYTALREHLPIIFTAFLSAPEVQSISGTTTGSSLLCTEHLPRIDLSKPYCSHVRWMAMIDWLFWLRR